MASLTVLLCTPSSPALRSAAAAPRALRPPPPPPPLSANPNGQDPFGARLERIWGLYVERNGGHLTPVGPGRVVHGRGGLVCGGQLRLQLRDPRPLLSYDPKPGHGIDTTPYPLVMT